MLRWMCGVARHDRISNDKIRGTAITLDISRELQGGVYGHLVRIKEECENGCTRRKEEIGKAKREVENLPANRL